MLDPWLDAIEPVVALGEEESQPHDCRPAETQSFQLPLVVEAGIQYFGHAHFLFEMRDDGRDVVYSFVGCCNLLAHPTSLTSILVFA